jgi:hypothetical protein
VRPDLEVDRRARQRANAMRYRKSEKGRRAHARGARKHRLKRLALLREARMRPCMDCGFKPRIPAQMHFDHRDPATKRFGVTQGIGRAPALLEAEIAKCDLVCANCHALRTAAQIAAGKINCRAAPKVSGA